MTCCCVCVWPAKQLAPGASCRRGVILLGRRAVNRAFALHGCRLLPEAGGVTLWARWHCLHPLPSSQPHLDALFSRP